MSIAVVHTTTNAPMIKVVVPMFLFKFTIEPYFKRPHVYPSFYISSSNNVVSIAPINNRTTNADKTIPK